MNELTDSFKNVDILIVTALAEELNAILKHLPDSRQTYSDDSTHTYYLGSLESKEGVFSFGCMCLRDMGNTDAGIDTTAALRDLCPSFVFMFGIAAAIEGKAKFADVIIPKHIYYYEQAKLNGDGIQIRPQVQTPSSFLSERLKAFVHTYSRTVDHDIKFGPFASGEKVIASKEVAQGLIEREPKLIGIEMESFGVSRAAAALINPPHFTSIRGVSDYADENKNDEWRGSALTNAAKFLVSFLKSGALPKSNIPSLKKRQPLIAIHHISLFERASVAETIDNKFKGFSIKEIPINQVSFYTSGQLLNPLMALKRQENLTLRLNDTSALYPQSRIGYFGLAHIPFMFLAGFQIGRRVIDVFATDRQSGKWIELQEKGVEPPLRILESPSDPSEKQGDVVIKASISYPVKESQLPKETVDSIASYHIGLENPKPDVVTTNEQVERYAQLFHSVLFDINDRFPNTQKIQLFLAAPPTIVFRFGQQVNRNIDPPVCVHNFSRDDNPNYGWSLNIVTGKVIDLRNERGAENV